MKIDVKLEGEPRAEKIRALPALLKRYLLSAFVESATGIASAASANVSHTSGSGRLSVRARTGELAGSFRIDVVDRGDSYSVKVGPTAYYSGWVESGHAVVKKGGRNQARLARKLGTISKYTQVPAHPYFMPAVEAAHSQYSALIRDAIDRAEKETQGA